MRCTEAKYRLLLVFIGIVSASLAYFSSCSSADPVIYKINHQLQAYWKYPQDIQERLLIQILADDDDGFDEIYEVFIIHDASELYWRVTKDQWDLVEEDNNEWIVLNNIVAHDYRSIPRGKYRVVLIDFSGYRDTAHIFLNQPVQAYDIKTFPTLEKSENFLFVPRNTLSNKNPDAPLLLELAYPPFYRDGANNQSRQIQEKISMLGMDGTLYEIEEDKSIRLFLNQNVQIDLYLHHIASDDILYSSGPYQIFFNMSQ